ncbi:hypothetical protein [Oceanisphaera sp. W20_SRM_FM3]|uniref:hypothetical protein n=1 Tax=Oceanisphaera sp. W20_SRM_FM3 TaxID=3240267 RepID=UPI003F9C0BDC
MKRRDFIANHFMRKDFIEDVMKSVAWTTLCSAVFTMSMAALKSGEYFQGVVVFIVFLWLSTISFMYVAVHVVIPLDSAMYPADPYWDEKANSLTGLDRFFEICKVFLVRKRIFYLSSIMGYVLYANEVTEYLAEKL